MFSTRLYFFYNGHLPERAFFSFFPCGRRIRNDFFLFLLLLFLPAAFCRRWLYLHQLLRHLHREYKLLLQAAIFIGNPVKATAHALISLLSPAVFTSQAPSFGASLQNAPLRMYHPSPPPRQYGSDASSHRENNKNCLPIRPLGLDNKVHNCNN